MKYIIWHMIVWLVVIVNIVLNMCIFNNIIIIIFALLEQIASITVNTDIGIVHSHQ